MATAKVKALIGLGELSLEEAEKGGDRYTQHNPYDQAEDYFLHALREAERLRIPESILGILINLAKLKVDQGNVLQSKQFVLQAKTLADSINAPRVK